MKDFDAWGKLKKEVNKRNPRSFKEKDIWWCFWGVNIGFEQDGDKEYFQRPVLIYKKLSENTCIVIPLTTSKKKHHFRKSVGHIENRNSMAILDQIKTIDSRRLMSHVKVLNNSIFQEIRKAVRNF